MDMSEDVEKYRFARVQGESCAQVTSFHKQVQRLSNTYGYRQLSLPLYNADLNFIKK